MSKLKYHEKGNVIVEFIALFLLLVAPLFTYFAWITVTSHSNLKGSEVLREVGQIISTGENLQNAVAISKRYLVLEGFNGELSVVCKSGDCPHRGSLMRIQLQNGPRLFSMTLQGGQWQ